MATQIKVLSALKRLATRIWAYRASYVRKERKDKADELQFELLKGLV